MYVITCSLCGGRHLVGPRSILDFANTDDGPVALITCPAGHVVRHHFRTGTSEVLVSAVEGGLAA